VRWEGNVACIGEKRHEYKDLVGKPRGKRTHEVNLREVGWSGMDWINLAQDRD
jgi:hypothetical protein